MSNNKLFDKIGNKMNFKEIELPIDLEQVEQVAKEAFSSTPDSSLEEWFSFEEMGAQIQKGRGICIKATDGTGQIVGITYAQQESPINGREGLEKWVIVIAAVKSEFSGIGVGSGLLKALEELTKQQGCVKMFVYTNKNDVQVISFYKKNGYENAGFIKDYQYGKDNSAAFLLKYL